LSKVEHEIIDCGLGERREVRAVKKGMSLISRDLQGKTQGAISFGIRSVHVSVTKMEVGRDVVDVHNSEIHPKLIFTKCLFYRNGLF